jgi:hypothetical protein
LGFSFSLVLVLDKVSVLDLDLDLVSDFVSTFRFGFYFVLGFSAGFGIGLFFRAQALGGLAAVISRWALVDGRVVFASNSFSVTSYTQPVSAAINIGMVRSDTFGSILVSVSVLALVLVVLFLCFFLSLFVCLVCLFVCFFG